MKQGKGLLPTIGMQYVVLEMRRGGGTGMHFEFNMKRFVHVLAIHRQTFCVMHECASSK